VEGRTFRTAEDIYEQKVSFAMAEDSISFDELLWKLPLFDDLFLSMQGQNVMLVDLYLRDLERDLLRELIEIERTPFPATLVVSALSQMWIFAVYRQAIVTYPAKTEILGNVIQTLARDRVVNVVEGTPCPAPWLRIEIDDVGAKRVNGGCGNELVCGPHLIAR
jgi:hypothetical protein